MPITHLKVSAIADTANTANVRPSDWNDAHVGTNVHDHSDDDSGGTLKTSYFLLLNTTSQLLGGETTYIRIPSKLDGHNLVEVAASCSGSSTSGSPVFTVKSGSTSMLTNNIVIDQGEYDSSTSGSPAVIDTSADGVATGDKVWVANSVAGSAVTYAGVELTFQSS